MYDTMVQNCSETCPGNRHNRDVPFTVPSVHLPLFGTMAKALRREQAIFLLDQRGFEVNATDSVSNLADRKTICDANLQIVLAQQAAWS